MSLRRRQFGSDADGPEGRDQLIGDGRPLPSASTLLTTFVKSAWSSPRVKAGLGLWVIGMTFMTLVPGLVKITPEMQSKYETLTVPTPEELFHYNDAMSALAEAEAVLYDSKVWFWRWRPEFRPAVEANQKIVAAKQSVVDSIRAGREGKETEAKSTVGLFSQYGMAEMKERFWGSFEAGKVFAQRQSMWNMITILLTSREENVLATFIQWVVMALINFTLGLIGALFYYGFSLASMIYTYGTNPLVGAAFFLLAFLGGASVVATYLAGLYGLTAGGMYVIGNVVLKNAAIKYERQQAALREQQRRQD